MTPARSLGLVHLPLARDDRKLKVAVQAPAKVLPETRVPVKLKVEGRSKSYLIRLWPNRSNLGQTPLGERFRACLRRWGISHGD